MRRIIPVTQAEKEVILQDFINQIGEGGRGSFAVMLSSLAKEYLQYGEITPLRSEPRPVEGVTRNEY